MKSDEYEKFYRKLTANKLIVENIIFFAVVFAVWIWNYLTCSTSRILEKRSIQEQKLWKINFSIISQPQQPRKEILVIVCCCCRLSHFSWSDRCLRGMNTKIVLENLISWVIVSDLSLQYISIAPTLTCTLYSDNNFDNLNETVDIITFLKPLLHIDYFCLILRYLHDQRFLGY